MLKGSMVLLGGWVSLMIEVVLPNPCVVQVCLAHTKRPPPQGFHRVLGIESCCRVVGGRCFLWARYPCSRAAPCHHWLSGFRVWGRVWVWGLGVWVKGSNFAVLHSDFFAECKVAVVKCWILSAECWVLSVQCSVWSVHCLSFGIECWVLSV